LVVSGAAFAGLGFLSGNTVKYSGSRVEMYLIYSLPESTYNNSPHRKMPLAAHLIATYLINKIWVARFYFHFLR
jgi:hypothetical protein